MALKKSRCKICNKEIKSKNGKRKYCGRRSNKKSCAFKGWILSTTHTVELRHKEKGGSVADKWAKRKQEWLNESYADSDSCQSWLHEGF